MQWKKNLNCVLLGKPLSCILPSVTLSGVYDSGSKISHQSALDSGNV